MRDPFNDKLPGPEQPQHPTPLPLFEQVINRLNYLTLDYTELTNYAYAMTSRIADTTRLCNEDEKKYDTDGSIISNLMVTMDKLEVNMSKLKLVVQDLEKSIIQLN